MSNSTDDLLHAFIRDAQDNIDKLERSKSVSPPPPPSHLNSIHGLQQMFRSNIDTLRDAIRELE